MNHAPLFSPCRILSLVLVTPLLLAGSSAGLAAAPDEVGRAADFRADASGGAPHQAEAQTRSDIQRLRERLRTMSDESAKSSQFVNKAQAQLERLSEQFEAAAKATAERDAARASREAEAFTDRVRRLHARMDLIDATGKGSSALELAVKTHFRASEEMLGEVVKSLQMSRAALAGMQPYEQDLTGIIDRLGEAKSAASAGANDAAVQLERALNATNELIDQLASDEARAATRVH